MPGSQAFASFLLGAALLLSGIGRTAEAQTPIPDVLTPDGGEVWEIGSAREIRWAAISGTNVSIELSRNGGDTFEPLFATTPNDGVELWTVSGPASTTCVVRVRSLDQTEVVAESNADFTVAEQVSVLQVTAPNGGEIWTAGSQQLITWTAPDGGAVRIELSRDGGLNYEVLFGSTPNDGSQPWTVTDFLSTTCSIRVTHVNDPALTDASNAAFEIASPPGIRITTPSGGELWEIGTRREIRWEGTLGGGARIELSRDGGATWETLFSNTPNDGVEEWQVEDPASLESRIRVTRLEPVDEVTLVGESAANFGIVESVSTLAVTRANGGDIFVIGTQQLVTWNAPAGGNVMIELSRNAGVDWEILFGSTPNDGAQLWTVTGPVSPSSLFRITRTDDDTLTDVSDAPFYITATPGLTVTSPNGDEVWTVGSVQTLFWTGLEGGRVKIELSRDGGNLWETLFENTFNDGAQRWVVTGEPSAEALVRVTRLSPPLVSDVSDAPFEIDIAPLAVVEPKDGDEWVIGTQRLVQWSTLPVGEVQIDLSRDGGTTWVPLFEGTPNDGGQFWLVEGPETEEAVVRVTALGDAAGFAMSEGVFRIVRGSLTLTAPNGGEQWAIGSHKVITWDTTTAGTVRLELSRNGGDLWEPLFLNTPNDGDELWTVTGPPCTSCQVRVASWQDGDLEDVSNGLFSLVCAPTVAVILPGQELGDSLNVTDCEAPHRPGSRGKLYTFSMGDPGLVSIDLRSTAFTGYLYLLDRDGNVLAEAPGLIDSFDLPAGGPYTIEVTSATTGATGGFILRLQQFTVALLSPSGGVTWKLGEYQQITWRSGAPGVPADVTLLRGDGTGPGEPIALATLNDGIELWRVTAPAAQRAVVRICIPLGSRGTQLCDQSSPFVLAPCSGGETRACYSGPPAKAGVGDCRRGTQTCGGDGVLGTCQGEALPQTDLCGDGRDQDCDGGDLVCRPCNPVASCSDGDACTADACVDGQCRNALPAPLALFDCRATALDQAFASIISACDGSSRPEVRAKQARRLAKVLARVQKLTARASAARSRRRCVEKITSARKTAMKMRHLLDRITARGIVCGTATSLIEPQLSGVGEAIIAVSSCDGKS